MDIELITTENPVVDEWRALSQYTYQANVKKYLRSKNLQSEDEKVDYITGCIGQSKAYFTAASNASIDIAPLLIYYGATNLLAGASTLMSGERPQIRNHGMSLVVPATRTRIADIEIIPSQSSSGSLAHFGGVFSKKRLVSSKTAWNLGEILGSIPDLKSDFENCYHNDRSYSIPLERVARKHGVLERFNPEEVSRYTNVDEALVLITDLQESYIEIQTSQQMTHVVLFPKLDGEDIGMYSILGRKYLQLGHQKDGKLLSPNQIILMYMGLYGFGYLSRYYPELWNPFITNDQTGERLVVERFLSICLRYLPNLILNQVYDRRLQYVNEADKVLDMTQSLTEKAIKKMIKDSIK